MWQILKILAQARNVVREEVHSPKRNNMMTTTKMLEKVVGSQAKGEALNGNGLKTPVANVDKVCFITS